MIRFHRHKMRPIDTDHVDPVAELPTLPGDKPRDIQALPATVVIRKCWGCGHLDTIVLTGTWDLLQIQGWRMVGATEEEDPEQGTPPPLLDHLARLLAVADQESAGVPPATVLEAFRVQLADYLADVWPGFDHLACQAWLEASRWPGRQPADGAEDAMTVHYPKTGGAAFTVHGDPRLNPSARVAFGGASGPLDPARPGQDVPGLPPAAVTEPGPDPQWAQPGADLVEAVIHTTACPPWAPCGGECADHLLLSTQPTWVCSCGSIGSAPGTGSEEGMVTRWSAHVAQAVQEATS